MSSNWLQQRTVRRLPWRAAVVAGLGVALGAAGSSGTVVSASNRTVLLASHACTAKTAKHHVTVDATNVLKFVPANVCLKKGGTVTWHNTGTVMHTTTDDPKVASKPMDAAKPHGAKDWNHPLPPEATWSHKFKVVGNYRYFCIPHETLGMRGTIKVVK